MEACCKCSGGHREAAPFTYFVAPIVLGATSVTGYPVPRTSYSYYVDEACDLLLHGFRLDRTDGRLQLVGLSVPGSEPFTVECLVTAVSREGGTASARIKVEVEKGISYGAYPLIFHPCYQRSYSPVTSAGLALQEPSLECNPSLGSAAGIATNFDLVMSMAASGSSGGVTGEAPFNTTKGALCRVQGRVTESDGNTSVYKTHVTLLFPKTWSFLSYDSGDPANPVRATVGQSATTARPLKQEDGLAPSRFIANCDNAVKVDRLTGQGTFEGFHIFDLDVATGALRLSPEAGVQFALNQESNGRGHLSFSCEIHGLYEWPPHNHGPSVAAIVEMKVLDDTCWLPPQTVPFKTGASFIMDVPSEKECRQACRSRSDCAFYQWNTACTAFRFRCPVSLIEGCDDQLVVARIPNCDDRSRCVDIAIPNHHSLSGSFCPAGDLSPGGTAYMRMGRSVHETSWLHFDAANREWLIQRSQPDLDFAEPDIAYMEFHGETLATIADDGLRLRLLFLDLKEALGLFTPLVEI